MGSGGPDKMPSDAEAEIHQRSRGDFYNPSGTQGRSRIEALMRGEGASALLVGWWCFRWLRLGSGLGKMENGEWRAWVRASDAGLDGTSRIHV